MRDSALCVWLFLYCALTSSRASRTCRRQRWRYFSVFLAISLEFQASRMSFQASGAFGTAAAAIGLTVYIRDEWSRVEKGGKMKNERTNMNSISVTFLWSKYGNSRFVVVLVDETRMLDRGCRRLQLEAQIPKRSMDNRKSKIKLNK
jgi:hypothetical protein